MKIRRILRLIEDDGWQHHAEHDVRKGSHMLHRFLCEMTAPFTAMRLYCKPSFGCFSILIP